MPSPIDPAIRTKFNVCKNPPRGCIEITPCSLAQATRLPVRVAAPMMALATPAVYN